MSLTEARVLDVGAARGMQVPPTPRCLHRLGTVRRLQGITRRAVARRLNTDVDRVKLQEREASDLLLSELYQWQEVLDVPISELLVEASDPLSAPVLKRAQLVRVMKTALALLELTDNTSVHRLVETLVGQLTEIMPELSGVGAWHAVGKRRRRDELGKAAELSMSEDVFTDLVD